jgi:hypothetical protein
MKKLYPLGALLIPLIGYAQTTYFNDQYGMPAGSATRSGNSTYFNDAYGMPQGQATQSGNTTFFNNQYGLPMGSATAPIPLQPLQQPPKTTYPMPIRPAQPYQKW